MTKKFRVEDGKGRYAIIRWSEENVRFDVQVWEISHAITLDGESAGDIHLWGSYELECKLYESEREDYGATYDGRLTCIEGLQKTLAHFDMKLNMSAEVLAGLYGRDDYLKRRMNETLKELGHDPRLVWLLGHVSYELMHGLAAGGGFDEVEIAAVEVVAKELGANEEQLKRILPEDWKSPDE